MRLASRLFLSGVASLALANSAPEFAPPPAWVKPIAFVAAPVEGDAPLRMLLSDEQIDFHRGSSARYVHVAALVQTAAGLNVGNIAYSWRPDVDTITIHALRIHRGNKQIDVLADQKFTVLRRETNLDAATLDGRLTAALQVDGLEVGDILEFEQTTVSRDPTLGNHVEAMAAGWNQTAVDHAHSRVRWATDVPLRVQSSAGLPPVRIIADASGKSVDLDSRNIKPLVLPKGAPLRFQLGRILETTDYANWSDVGALMAPLYVKASQIDPKGPLAAKVASIRAANADPLARASAALILVQKNIRYVALQMGVGGYVPAQADATWASRFGDCKAKTAMLLGMLHDLGIEAVPVAVSVQAGDVIEGRLPMLGLFDHVLVRATIAGKEYWLDGTRSNDRDLYRLAVPNFRWGVALVPNGSGLVSITPGAPTEPDIDYRLAIDARGGVFAPAKTHAEVDFRGDAGEGLRLSIAALPEATRDSSLRDYFRDLYNFVELSGVSAHYDQATGVERLSMDGIAKLDWKDEFLRIPGSSVGYKADFNRPPGTLADAPFAVAFPSYGRAITTVQIPAGVTLWAGKIGPDLDETLAGVHYRRAASINGNVLTLTKVEQAVASEIPAGAARAAQARLRAINDEDVYLSSKGYKATEVDMETLGATVPASGSAYFERGLQFVHNKRWAEAIADFTKAMEANPKDVWPVANRAIAYYWSQDLPHAEADFAAAEKIDPENAVLWRGRGMLAGSKGDFKGAIVAFGRSLTREPGSSFALRERAAAYFYEKDFTHALADADAVARAEPKNGEIYLLRANIYKQMNKPDQAMAQADELMKALPDDPMAASAAARIYGSYRRTDHALALLAGPIARNPSDFLYINRYYVRDAKDVAGRRGDLDAALNLNPKNWDALFARSELEVEQGDYESAIADYSRVYAANPKNIAALRMRGVARWRAGDRAGATRDLAEAKAKSTTAFEYNSLCWALATHDVALDDALASCEKAVALAPGIAGILDSRGLAKLKLGRIDAAIADYDAVIKLIPNLASSLFGRSIALSRKGEREKAAADRRAAITANPDVVAEFARYGLTS